MNEENLLVYFPLFASDWSILVKLLLTVLFIVLISVAIYDRFIQRKNQLLINYPLIGRLRYFFYLLRNPMRQYFGDETFYGSFEKIDWINKVSEGKSPYLSFSPTKPYGNQKTLFKHANFVKEVDEVEKNFSVIFGENRKEPYVSKSIIGRSAMSDGAISPEGTRAFSLGAFKGEFPINTGEGGLTSNFLAPLNIGECRSPCLEIKTGTWFAKMVYRILRLITNKEVSQRVYKKMVVRQKDRGTFVFDNKKLVYYRIDWNKSLDQFPIIVPIGLPDIIFQMGSGLYGARDEDGKFDDERYKKVMRFCRMTELKLAQGAKQTGGKLLATKVSDDIAYYRGIPAHKDLISPNRFPYADDMETFFDFISRLQTLSEKPVGFKIVISNKEEFEVYAKALKSRKEEGKSIADFLTIDGGDGGSATAPLEMMSKIGLPIRESLRIVDEVLMEYGLREEIKIIAAEKVLTPDDVVELICYGADFVNIARGFMISAGCIRARECSGAGGRDCPVGLATMNEIKRSRYLVLQKAKHIANYHNELLNGVRSLLAVMGKSNPSELGMDDLIYHE
ncbi:MAG: FMN-binding glutamate synthase family protein [Sulfurovum sp.]|uniref:FMN-binding glutamate synthase family protein n=1 Tax=Sulfurovum sp. TaxID=1969726 RepID=UPI0028682057|nr:FMN-binding glutamate synthase family protein [Sulfurovum sp.]MCO4846032.1 FMN-binding glutamate synthase family protein [Sulfurovum sp.]